MSETLSFSRALYYSGNVRHDERGFVFEFYDSEARRKGGEMVICYLRSCSRRDRKQSAFPDVRKTYKPDVRYHLEFKDNFLFLSRNSGFRKTGSLSCRGGEMPVSPAAATAFCDNEVFAVAHVFYYKACFLIFNDRAFRNADIKVFSVLSEHLRTFSVFPVFRNEFMFETQVGEGVEVIGYR